MYSTQNFCLYLTVIITKLDFNNGLSKGIKPDYIKPFQHLFEKNFNKLLICCEWDHKINLTGDAPLLIPAKTYRMMPARSPWMKWKLEKFKNLSHLMPVPVSSLQKRTAVVTSSKIIKKSMLLPSRIKPHCPALMISFMCSKMGNCSPKWTLSGDTTMYALRKVMNGKLPSWRWKTSLSLPSCILAYAIHQEYLCAWYRLDK